MEQLTTTQKGYLSEFQQKVTEYITNHRWTDVDFRGDKIPVTMSINILSGTESGDFVAQMVLSSQRRTYANGRPTQESSLILRVLDPKWSFSYLKGQPFYHDEFQYNDLTSFLDFYMYLVIGIDFDSMELLQGSPFYQKAVTVAQRAISGSHSGEWQGQPNQYSRMNFINELLNATYEKFRSGLYWYYYEGLDFLPTEKDAAQQGIVRALEDMADVIARTSGRSLLLTMWLESKAGEFCNLLNGYGDRPRIMNQLIQVDPVRAEQYRKCNF